jgi:hypothetical protein
MADLRNQFEIYAQQLGYRDFENSQDDADSYRNPHTHGAWNFWRAALQAKDGPGTPSARLSGILAKLSDIFPDLHNQFAAAPPETAYLERVVALQAQQGDAKDAERYRWLRSDDIEVLPGQREICVYLERLPFREDQTDELLVDSALDTAIDAAMLAARREG